MADAQGYLALTREQADCTLDFAAPEGAENGEYNGFGDESLAGIQMWNVHEVVSTEAREVPDADEALVMTNDQVFSTTLDGIDYSANETSIVVIERYGRIVLTANLDSYCCTTGYAEPAGAYKALLADLAPAVDLFREHAGGAAQRRPGLRWSRRRPASVPAPAPIRRVRTSSAMSCRSWPPGSPSAASR